MNNLFFRPNSLTWKAITFLLAVSLTIAGCFYIAYSRQANELDGFNKSAIASVVTMFKISVNDFVVTGDKENIENIVDKAIHEGLIHGIEIYEEDKLALRYPSKLDKSLESTDVNGLTSIDSKLSVHFKLFLNQKVMIQSRERFLIWALFFVGCLITTMVIIGYFINSRIVKPLLSLSRSARLIANGQYDFKAGSCNNDEIGLLTYALEAMSKDNHVKELVAAQAEIVIANHDRTRYLDTLINDTSPYLTEALVTLQSLSDRPIQRKLINRVLLFVVAQLEQARALIDESSVPFNLSVEKFNIEEFAQIVNEYGMFFSRTRNIQIDFKLKTDPYLNIKNISFLIDAKLLIKLFSLIFEIMSSKINVESPMRSTIWLMIDNIDNDKADVEIIIRNECCTVSTEECQIVNGFFSSRDSVGCELDDLPLSSKQNKLAYQSLKSLLVYLRAEYNLNCINGNLESRFKCRVISCKEGESLEERLSRIKPSTTRSNTILVGSSTMVAKSSLSKGQVSTVSYDDFLIRKEISSDANYVIDHITSEEKSIECIKLFKGISFEKRNLAVLINQSSMNDLLIDFFYEYGVDLILHGYLDGENLRKVCTDKVRSQNNSSLSGIIESYKT